MHQQLDMAENDTGQKYKPIKEKLGHIFRAMLCYVAATGHL